tara:strand:+ start:103 stop:504 length:402 start_codon:yes stop_codon:yes gene_type:complete
MQKGNKMAWYLWLIIGAGTGAGGVGLTWFLSPKKIQVVETNKIVEKMVEVDSSLTSEDLIKVPCSTEYIAVHGELLCSLMFCRMNTRSGNNSNTAAAQECEAISNIHNKKHVYAICGKAVNPKECIEFFDRRL